MTAAAIALRMIGMSTSKEIGQAARKELKQQRTARKLTQRGVAERGGFHHGVVGWLDGNDSGTLTLDSFVLYARGLGTQAWRVLRDVEESLFGED